MNSNSLAINRNITLIFWYNMLCNMLFMQPIIILFYQTKGLPISEFFLLQPIFSIVSLLLETPFSYIADRWQRKGMMLIASVCTLIGITIIFLAQDFWSLAWAPLFLGLAHCSRNGSSSAVLYDSLVALGREDEHKKILGKIRAYSSYSLAMASGASGVAYSFDINMPFYLSFITSVPLLIISMLIHEPPRTKFEKGTPIWETLKVAIKQLHNNPYLKWVVIFSSIIFMANLKGFWMLTPLLEQVGYSVTLIGLACAGVRFLTGFTSQHTHRLEQYISAENLLAIALIFTVTNYTVGSMDLGYLVIIPLSLVFMAYGVTDVVSHDILHKSVVSEVRATLVSLKSTLTRLQFAIVTPLFGYMIGAVNFQFAMFAVGGFCLVAGGYSYIMLSIKK